ncbi:MAG: membrane protein insertion efficiency factor YidD [Thermodesulfovibrionales bacterium]|nr:membrane protein insertion efficiency factor YidD [Thermodesulfovibrionales bacterium]
MKKIAIFCIKTYRYLLSPLIPQSCRFTPTCSEYSISAIDKFGFIRGTILSIKRILRCNPLSKGGYDPVMPLEVKFKGIWRK